MRARSEIVRAMDLRIYNFWRSGTAASSGSGGYSLGAEFFSREK